MFYSKVPMMLMTDYYKTIHHSIYPEGTSKIVSYWTPRQTRIPGIDYVVMFGLQAFIKRYLIEEFNKNFFERPRKKVMNEYIHILENTFGAKNINGIIDRNKYKHIKKLHKLGYLPIQIKALEEGTIAPIGVPMIEITNTNPEFYWLVNYLETLMSCSIWHPMTSATIAYNLFKLANKYYSETSSKYYSARNAMGDFSLRGQTSLESGMASSAAFLTSFFKTATIPANVYFEQYYNADVSAGKVGEGTPSTEHSATYC